MDNPGKALQTGQVASSAVSAQLLAPQAGANAGVGRACKGVWVRALPTNSAAVFIGGTSGVTVGTGLALAATDPPIHLLLDDASRLWVVSAAAQTICWAMD